MRVRSKALLGLAAGAVAASVVLAIDAVGPLGRRLVGSRTPGGEGPLRAVEWKTYDWRMARTAVPSQATPDIVLVHIDEYSLRNLQPNAGRWPWPRAVHSMLLDYLARAPARLVVYDVNFAEPDTRTGFLFGGTTWSGEESDRALVESVRTAGNVILPVDATFEGEMAMGVTPPSVPDGGFRPARKGLASAGVLGRRVVFPPFPELTAAAAGVGHNLLVFDSDGPIRHTVPFVATNGASIPSLGLVAATRAAAIPPGDVRQDASALSVGPRRLPLTQRQVSQGTQSLTYNWGLIRFHGPAVVEQDQRAPYASYSFYDVLVSEEQLLALQAPAIDPAVFKGKIVFVGVTAAGLADVFETPFAQGRMPGAQVHAAVADDMLSGRFLRPADRRIELVLLATATLIVGLLALLVPISWAIGSVVAGLVVLWLVAFRLFGEGLWLNLTEPTLGITVALFAGISCQYVLEGRDKRVITHLFSRYVSRDVFSQLVAHPEMAHLHGERREMTVLFSDIRGFTTLSERATPEDVVGLLNEYFTVMVDVVFRHHGTVDKFVGDMVMAVFGAPLDDSDHAAHAIDAALDMLEELKALNARWGAEGRFTGLDIGIGINSGQMIAGNIGSSSNMSYTVIGDAVNLGSRLQSLTKDFGAKILVSGATAEGLSARYVFRSCGEVVVRGRTQPVGIFEVVARAGSHALTASQETR